VKTTNGPSSGIAVEKIAEVLRQRRLLLWRGVGVGVPVRHDQPPLQRSDLDAQPLRLITGDLQLAGEVEQLVLLARVGGLRLALAPQVGRPGSRPGRSMAVARRRPGTTSW
jgi:hypothetical protein